MRESSPAARPRASPTKRWNPGGPQRSLAETHGRDDLGVVVQGLEVIATRQITYRDAVFHEPNYDAVRARRPEVVLIDELAHTNAPGSPHEKRWQDVADRA